MSEKGQVAVFIDFENIVISAEELYGRCELSQILKVAEQYGRVVLKRAYADWSRFSRYRQDLMALAVDLTQLFRYGSYSRKNSADLVLAVDALEVAFLYPEIDTFLLVSGDSDFSALARKIRSRGQQVIGVGLRDATSDVLVGSCDAYFTYDDLIEGNDSSNAFELEQARQLLLTTLRQIGPRFPGDQVSASTLKHEMIRIQPEFDESKLGFRQFHQFLESNRDLIILHETPSGYEVSLRSIITSKSEIDRSLQYRTALNTAGFRLVSIPARQQALQDLYRLLASNPGQLTWHDCVERLDEQRQPEVTAYSRDELEDAARLLRHAPLFESQPQSWKLDPLTLQADLSEEEYLALCESVYVTVLVEKNLEIQDELLATLLYGTGEAVERIRHLRQIAQKSLPQNHAVAELISGYEWPRHIIESAELQIVLRDLIHWQLDEEPSLDTANRLNNQGLRIRTSDFERARVYFLRAAKMMYVLLQRKEPGASLMDLEWYLASYSAATAGAHFSQHNYERSLLYYQAFFALVKETEPVWDKVRKLVPPMISFYFTIAPNEHSDLLKVSPGRTHPARLAVILHNHPNPQIRRRWLGMVRDLVRINPPLLRGIVQRLAFLEEEDQLAGARETRRTLTRLINNEPVAADPLADPTAASVPEQVSGYASVEG